MIRYDVMLEIEPALAAEVVPYLRDVHIPEIFATGCFRTIRLERGAAGRLRATYLASRSDDLDHYLRVHAPALRTAFQARFPTGVRVARETWTEIAVWE